MAASEAQEMPPVTTQENGPQALPNSVSQKQLRFREGDSEDQIQETSSYSSRGYNKGNRVQCPNLGAPCLGGESFDFYHSVCLPQLSWCSVAREKRTVCQLDSDFTVLWVGIPPKLLPSKIKTGKALHRF